MEQQMTAAEELVLGFVAALSTASATLRVAVPQMERLADIWVLARSGRLSRSGEAGGYEYSVHGAGCRLIDPDGVHIDVDFVDETEVFDLWRLRCYGRSLPTPVDLPAEEFRSAIQRLNTQVTQVRPGWFGVRRTGG
ncbi:DUF6896 domain-containing protein [Streptomyces sp. LN500]|uniref:DUF6896 domain-containing protein n=1 Tax=Streptomyces sp. LN500 TaxID=3112978 RepID=UPI00371DE7BE